MQAEAVILTKSEEQQRRLSRGEASVPLAANGNGVKPAVASQNDVNDEKGGVTDDGREESGGDEDEDEEDGWETASILEQLLDDGTAVEYATEEEICTPAEARTFRARLHEIGLNAFVSETLGEGTISARKLCTAFAVRIPSWFTADEPDDSFYQLLGLAMVRELQRRQRLPNVTTIDHVAELLKQSKNVLVITGAGISTSLGIPDFRSKDKGFYTLLRNAGYSEPEEVFDLEFFDANPKQFYDVAGMILQQHGRWTPTHQFIRLLQDKGKLLRNYTQNIDNIEAQAGVAKEKLVQCHGSWATATCRKCAHVYPGTVIAPAMEKKEVAYCTNCPTSKPTSRPTTKRKRSNNAASAGQSAKNRQRWDDLDEDDNDKDDDLPFPGVLKPDITFFGEKLPDHFFDTLTSHDHAAVDLVLVMGTSMKVAPVSEIPSYLPPGVPQVYISRDPIWHIDFDVNLLGDCDVVVQELCRRAGWTLGHEMCFDEGAERVEVQLRDAEVADHVWTVKKVAVNGTGGSAGGGEKAGEGAAG